MQILFETVVVVGEFCRYFLAYAENINFLVIKLSRNDRIFKMIADIVGLPDVDAGKDAFCFEANAYIDV